MAAQSPIKPADLGSISTGALACDALKELKNTRSKMQTFLAWLLANDSSGNLGPDFLLALSQQFLFDAAKKGYLVGTDSATGYLALFQYLALAKLDPAGAVDGDTLVFDGDSEVWKIRSAPFVYLAPTSGGTNPPSATTGGVLTVAHGLGASPSQFEAFLECNATDGGFAVGDKVSAHDLAFWNNSTNERQQGTTVYANTTQIGISFKNGTAGDSYQLMGKASFDFEPIAEAKWDVKLRAAL